MNLARLKQQVRTQFPKCPGLYVDEVAERLAKRRQMPGLQRSDIEAMVAAVIRHQLTDYDRLRTSHELTPEEAAACVDGEVADWIDSWRGVR